MELSKKNMKKILFIILSAILFYSMLKNLGMVFLGIGYVWDLLHPFIIGFAIAFILNVPMKRIEQYIHFKKSQRAQKLKRPLAFLLTLLLVLGIIILALFIIIPQLGNTIQILAERIQENYVKVEAFWKEAAKSWPLIEQYLGMVDLEWSSITKNLVEWLQSSASSLFNTGAGAVGSIINSVVSFFMGLVFAVYLLLQKEKLMVQVKKVLYALLPEQKADRIRYIAVLTGETFSHFLSGQCLEACILGLMFFVSMTILRMPYAMLMGIVIAITALIPIFGAFIGGATGFFLIVMENPLQAVAFLVMFLVLQQLEGNLIYPHVVGNSVGLPSIWVFAAVTLGGSLMGITGMILFIPICSVIYTLFREYIVKRLDRRNISEEKWMLGSGQQ